MMVREKRRVQRLWELTHKYVVRSLLPCWHAILSRTSSVIVGRPSDWKTMRKAYMATPRSVESGDERMRRAQEIRQDLTMDNELGLQSKYHAGPHTHTL